MLDNWYIFAASLLSGMLTGALYFLLFYKAELAAIQSSIGNRPTGARITAVIFRIARPVCLVGIIFFILRTTYLDTILVLISCLSTFWVLLLRMKV